ncbi:MAG: hypothetical protein V4561_02960 [Bacteroidota bacterium]
MKKKLLLAFTLLFGFQQMYAQTAADVLEKGIVIKSGKMLLLRYRDSTLKYDLVRSLQDQNRPPDYTNLRDSTFFLAVKRDINVFIRPLNPLNYSINTENKVYIDPINEAAATAMGKIIDAISQKQEGADLNSKNSSPFREQSPLKSASKKTQSKLDSLNTLLKGIDSMVVKTQKPEIIDAFKKLKGLTFESENKTKDEIEKIRLDIDKIKKHFEDFSQLIQNVKEKTETFPAEPVDEFIFKRILTLIVKDITVTMLEQKKRYDNLEKIYTLVYNTYEKASIGGGDDGLRWSLPLKEIPSEEGKISAYTITIKESGYKLSDEQEIVSIESKSVLDRAVIVRKFQRFVPEVSVGTAFTFFKFNTYGTTSDSTGQQYVGSAQENTLRNLNIATMVNFNYYIPNSTIHPLFQLGLGVNSEMPTLLAGFGIRSNINGIRRLAISGGIAMTWSKELDKLKVGDKISGTDDINKDLKPQFSWPPKPYIGLQYNF